MMNFLEKFRGKLLQFLFPFVERFCIVITLTLLAAFWITWSVPQVYGQTRSVIIWLALVYSQIYFAGRMERDCLPIQHGSGAFYRIYRAVDQIFFLFFFICLFFILFPKPLWAVRVFAGAFLLAAIISWIGDRKYRPKKPEEPEE